MTIKIPSSRPTSSLNLRVDTVSQTAMATLICASIALSLQPHLPTPHCLPCEPWCVATRSPGSLTSGPSPLASQLLSTSWPIVLSPRAIVFLNAAENERQVMHKAWRANSEWRLALYCIVGIVAQRLYFKPRLRVPAHHAGSHALSNQRCIGSAGTCRQCTLQTANLMTSDESAMTNASAQATSMGFPIANRDRSPKLAPARACTSRQYPPCSMSLLLGPTMPPGKDTISTFGNDIRKLMRGHLVH